MNYFTKGWYELCQKTSNHLLLKEERQAEAFSEEYFQELYNEKLTVFLDLHEQAASHLAECEVAKESYIPHEPFDREKAYQHFHKAFIYNQEHIKKILPKEILKKIADIRVYVLDKASRQVINAVTLFCEDNEKLVSRTINEYKEYYKKALKSFDRNMVENINFHDCTIIDIKQTEQSLSILFDNSGGFKDIDVIQFENYKIIKQDALLQNSWWLYDEIYKTNGKYELHILLQNKNMDLVEFIVSAEYIFFKRNQEK
ncbi:DUF4085 domain-containing protein [Clostridium estertheticum]|uniref:DUF4085 family protein n=1 Tax=Clostridium estertheticum TaxID=238834 RepID=UPI001C0DB177|nr:DUF4085 family protein [Clostridium estertheticum]MBU3202482.1 DUF4085 domain-containing protein [Clostridium estertheticum]WAG63437.1 DUF4085 domain-containing protein [Clostridium estertheticum]